MAGKYESMYAWLTGCGLLNVARETAGTDVGN